MLAAGIWAKISFFKTQPASAYLCAAQEGHRGTENVRDKYLNFSRDRRSTLEKATPRPRRPFRKKSFESVHESLSRGTRRRSRGRAKCRSKKSTETESVYIGIQWPRDWTVGFCGGLKWRSRRNGKTHQNEIQDSDRPWRRRESLEKIRIYFISLSARIHKRFFFPTLLLLPFRACFPLDDFPTFSVSSVMWKSRALLSRDIKAEFIKICAIKATWHEIYSAAIFDTKNAGNYAREIMPELAYWTSLKLIKYKRREIKRNVLIMY